MVLIVDDQQANLKVLYSFLQDQDLDVRVLESGEQTLELLAHTLPDIILLDVMMPGMDGFTVCRRIKATERTAHIPVVFLTALDEEKDRLAGFEAGGVDYITKPFRKAEVLARLGTHLALEKKQQELKTALEQVRELAGILEQRVAERTMALERRNAELQRKNLEIEQSNIALRVLVNRQQSARAELEEAVAGQLKQLVLPYLNLLAAELDDERHLEYLALIRERLDAPLQGEKLANPLWNLTPREILVADLVMQGKNSSDIGRLLRVSPRTVERYRSRIRGKIGLTDRKTDLRDFLARASLTS